MADGISPEDVVLVISDPRFVGLELMESGFFCMTILCDGRRFATPHETAIAAIAWAKQMFDQWDAKALFDYIDEKGE